jgi:hypothetical protein
VGGTRRRVDELHGERGERGRLHAAAPRRHHRHHADDARGGQRRRRHRHDDAAQHGRLHHLQHLHGAEDRLAAGRPQHVRIVYLTGSTNLDWFSFTGGAAHTNTYLRGGDRQRRGHVARWPS